MIEMEPTTEEEPDADVQQADNQPTDSPEQEKVSPDVASRRTQMEHHRRPNIDPSLVS